jgi:D-3-phosphoglycerate dehydrogenase
VTKLQTVVLVTPRSFGAGDPCLRRELQRRVATVRYHPSGGLSAEQLIALLDEVQGWIAGFDHIDRQVIEAAPKLRVISRYGTGTDRVDLQAARERGIVVTHTPAANADAVAELAIAMIFALARGLSAASAETKAGLWTAGDGLGVAGRTVGILGLGAVGQALAWRARAVGCRVVGFDPAKDARNAPQHVELAGRDAVVARADFLSLHLPLSQATDGMVDRALLAAMKPGAFLINTSRGALVDEQALLCALADGHLRGAALDTLRDEPPDPGNPLLSQPNVIVTPHIGARTDRASAAMGWAALRDCLSVLNGETPRHPVCTG